MNTEITNLNNVAIRITSFSDGVYNLELTNNNLKTEIIEVDRKEAERICNLMGEELPNAEKENPQQWG